MPAPTFSRFPVQSLARTALFPALLLSMCGMAQATSSTVVAAATAHAGTSGKDAVPGLPGFVFTNFGRFYNSDGTTWVTSANISGPGSAAATDQAVIIGAGTIFSFAAREGVTPVGDGGELLNLSGIAVPRINIDGTWAIAFTPAGSTANIVIRKDASGFATIAKGGELCPALNANYGNGMAGAAVLGDGTVAFIGTGTVGTPRYIFAENGNTILTEEVVTEFADPLPTGNGGALREITFAQNTQTFFITPDGSSFMYLCEVDSVVGVLRSVIRDNVIVQQIGQALDGAEGATISSLSELWMEPDGTWFTRGSLSTGSTFISRNGTLVARVGGPITPGSSENWSALTDYKGNRDGDYIITGNTNAAAASNEVAVFNGTTVVMREGDAVDLDGDGVFTDGLFIHSFRDRCFLGDDGFFYVGARMKNSATTTSSIGANVSLIRAQVVPCVGDFNQDGGVDGQDVEAFFIQWEQGEVAADVNRDGGVDGQDVERFFVRWSNGC